MAKMGRPTKLTPEVRKNIVDAIQAGNYIETAAAYAGISKPALYDWLKRGAKEKQRLAKNPRARILKEEAIYVDFSNAVEKALATAEVRDVLIIGRAAEEQWQAAAWRLERKFPDRWGRRKLDIEHSGGLELKHDGVARMAEQLEHDADSRELLKELFRRGEGTREPETGISES